MSNLTGYWYLIPHKSGRSKDTIKKEDHDERQTSVDVDESEKENEPEYINRFWVTKDFIEALQVLD